MKKYVNYIFRFDKSETLHVSILITKYSKNIDFIALFFKLSQAKSENKYIVFSDV